MKPDENGLPERVHGLNVLLDVYGKLLPSRQKQVMEMKLGEDLSFGEIAEALSISRQASEDALKRGIKAVLRYEDTLGLAAKSEACLKIASRALSLLRKMNEDNWDRVRQEVVYLLDSLVNGGESSNGV
ncbi:MAG: sigma factor-like helix-turn-helix DNA-binding protein [Bacillota bacterium]